VLEIHGQSAHHVEPFDTFPRPGDTANLRGAFPPRSPTETRDDSKRLKLKRVGTIRPHLPLPPSPRVEAPWESSRPSFRYRINWSAVLALTANLGLWGLLMAALLIAYG
jgi:hypothetical protein